MRISNSYKTTAFADLMEKVRDELKHEKNNKLIKSKINMAKMSVEERNEQHLISLINKIENLTTTVNRQEETINELNDKIESMKCYRKPEDVTYRPQISITSPDNKPDSKRNNNDNYDDISVEEFTSIPSKFNPNKGKLNNNNAIDTMLGINKDYKGQKDATHTFAKPPEGILTSKKSHNSEKSVSSKSIKKVRILQPPKSSSDRSSSDDSKTELAGVINRKKTSDRGSTESSNPLYSDHVLTLRK